MADPKERPRILLVDDEQQLLDSLGNYLRLFYDVTTTADAREASRWIEGSRVAYEVIVCDLIMPRMSGAELFQAACCHEPALADRFLFITGGAIKAEARQLIRDRPGSILYKPFPLTTLHESVEAIRRQFESAPRPSGELARQSPATDLNGSPSSETDR